MAKSPKPGSKRKEAAVLLEGTADGPLKVNVRIVDPEYPVDALADDIKHQRVWIDGKPDGRGWVDLVYSADGTEGNPWQIGKIRFTFNPQEIDPHLKNVSAFVLKPGKE